MAELSGGAKLEAYLKDMESKVSNASTLNVGFPEGSTYPDGTSVAMIAAIQNFGAPSRGIPPRPFFSNMIKAKGDEWPDTLGGLLNHYGMDAGKALTALGAHIGGQLGESIDETNSPPNSPVTNLLKQRFPMGGQKFADVLQARHDVANGATAPAGKPLVQSGFMAQSITSVVK